VTHETILRDYRQHENALSAAALAAETTLRERLAAAQIEVHFVSSRVKAEASLRKKIARPDKTYRTLWDVTDLVGVRVSTYFEDTIEDVARVVEELFTVDFRHSTDKLRFRDHGRFGYRSMHYVCGVPASIHPDARFEIQIRTALQHAWAEVEHDLGYKAEDAVPEMIKRRFSRVASLLEIADQEFVSIRRDLRAYREAAREQVSRGPGANGLPLDALSLEAACRTSPVETLDGRLAALLGKPLADESFYPDYLARMACFAGLDNTEALHLAVEEHAEAVTQLAPAYFAFAQRAWGLDPKSFPSVQRGYALLFVAHAALIRGPELGLSKVARLTRMYADLDFAGDEGRAHEVASGLLAALGSAPTPAGE
jgi:putative GTP pyrophosphokinase